MTGYEGIACQRPPALSIVTTMVHVSQRSNWPLRWGRPMPHCGIHLSTMGVSVMPGTEALVVSTRCVPLNPIP